MNTEDTLGHTLGRPCLRVCAGTYPYPSRPRFFHLGNGRVRSLPAERALAKVLSH